MSSRETFDQGYWLKLLNLISSLVTTLMSLVSPVPSVFIFQSPL